VQTIFSTHTEGRNNKIVLENCTTTRNLCLSIGERGVLKWIIKKQEEEEEGCEGGGVHCKRLTRNAVQSLQHGIFSGNSKNMHLKLTNI